MIAQARGGTVDAKMWTAAIEAYSKACQAQPNDCRPFFFRGKLYLAQNLYNLAERDFSTVLQLQCQDTNLTEGAKAELESLRLKQAPEQ